MGFPLMFSARAAELVAAVASLARIARSMK
jgi:hypothetical protein